MWSLKSHNDGGGPPAAAAGVGAEGDIGETGGPRSRAHDRRGPLPLWVAVVVGPGYVAASAGSDRRAVLGTCVPVTLHTYQFSGLLVETIFKDYFCPGLV